MFREPKALKEIHQIQEQIYREEKNLTGKQIVEKTRREADVFRKKYNLKPKQRIHV